jgi:cytochrome c556
VVRAAVLIAVAALAFAACGSATPAARTTATKCAATAKALKKIDRDLVALRAAYELPVSNKLLGNKAINVATDRFLNDVALAPISNLQRNRLIDHAMAAVGTHCEQCFQAFEAARPIPAIKAGDSKCPKA